MFYVAYEFHFAHTKCIYEEKFKYIKRATTLLVNSIYIYIRFLRMIVKTQAFFIIYVYIYKNREKVVHPAYNIF